jgi:hypothetical protein
MTATPPPMMAPPMGAPQRLGVNTATANPTAVMAPAASNDTIVRSMS